MTTLREALDASIKTEPVAELDHVDLQRRGVTQRRLLRFSQVATGVATIALGAAIVVGVSGLQSPDVDVVQPPTGTASDCPITLPTGDFTPPAPYPQDPVGDGQAWYGTEDLWTVLPLDGEYGSRKSVWWSTHFAGGQAERQPDITVTWRRLDEPDSAAITSDGPGTNAYTEEEGRWMIAGIDPHIPGCWEVTAIYRGAELTYTYWYEEDTGLPSPAQG